MRNRSRYVNLLLISMLVVISALQILNQRTLSYFQPDFTPQLAPIQQRLAELETRPQPDIPALKQHIDALLARQLSGISVLTGKISSLQQKIDDLQPALAELRQQAKKPLPVPPPQPVAVTRRRAPIPHSPRAATAPFTLAGIEYRAGNAMAVIMPLHAQRLEQVILLQPGEQWQGWRLIRLSQKQALFRNGNKQLQLRTPG